MFSHKEEYLLCQDRKIRRAYFYIFTSQNSPPNPLSKQEYINIYSNFHFLRSEHDTTSSSSKRKVSSDLTDDANDSRSTISFISPEQKNERKYIIKT